MDYDNITTVPWRHWDDHINHINFRNYLANKLNLDITIQIGWYSISSKDIINNKGSGLLNGKYNGRTIEFLKGVFPEFIWYPWLFDTPLKNFWNDLEIQKQYMEWLSNKFKWTSKKDYYKLSGKLLKENYGSGLYNKYNSLINLVNNVIG